MDFSIVVATDKNNGIGSLNNTLPWKCTDDLNFFKQVTLNGAVIMGRNTFMSLPKNCGLANRKNIVLTNNPDAIVNESVCCVKSLDDALAYCKENNLNKPVHTALYLDVNLSRSPILISMLSHSTHPLAHIDDKIYPENYSIGV